MTKKIMRSAIDAGFRWSAAHKEEREEVLAEFPRRFAGGINSWGYGVAMFRQGSRYRHFWQSSWSDEPRLHLTPLGTFYVFSLQSGPTFWSGSFIRADGTMGAFEGRHFHPLYCVGCGRADLRRAEKFTCTEELVIPAELLIQIPLHPHVESKREAERAEAIWREKARYLEEEHAAKPPPIVEPPPLPAPAPRPQPVRERPVKPRGPVEALLVSVLSSLWGTFKFLLLICLIAFAAARL